MNAAVAGTVGEAVTGAVVTAADAAAAMTGTAINTTFPFIDFRNGLRSSGAQAVSF
jgi:hypothetical protein